MFNRVMSIDLSTKLIGIAMFQELKDKTYKLVSSIQYNLVRNKDYTLADQLSELRLAIQSWFISWNPGEVITERPTAYGNGIKVAYACGVLYELCGYHQIPIIEYSPSEVKKEFTGKGNATKEEMIAKAIELFPKEGILNGDIKCRREYDRSDSIAIGYTYIKKHYKAVVL